MKIPLGSRVRDKVTGYQGIVMGRTSYLTGCDTYGVLSGLDKDGKPADWQWFDDQRLEIVVEREVVIRSAPLPQEGQPG